MTSKQRRECRCQKSRIRTALLQLFRQRNNVIVEKANLALVPRITRIDFGSSLFVRGSHFEEQTFVPLAEYMPVLHGVRNIRSLWTSGEKSLEKQAQERGARGVTRVSFYLNQVLNHNGCFAIDRVTS
jgi:hypothetical protein